jgi:hypothetical protein
MSHSPDNCSTCRERVATARERRRIRRLIAPHILDLRITHGTTHTRPCDCVYHSVIRAIDAATRAPKKARTK